jgi:hypothetical protein
MTRMVRVLGLVLGFLLNGCLPASSGDEAFEGIRRDSSGIILWDYPAATTAAELRLSRRPKLVIGSDERNGEQELRDVSHALFIVGRGILVADRGAGELKLFADSEQLLWTVGREVIGQGGIRSFSWIQTWQDSIAVYDRRLRRLNVLDHDGVFIRSVEIESDSVGGRPPFADAVGVTDSGGVLVELFWNPTPSEGHLRPSRQLTLLDGKNHPGPALLEYPGAEIQFVPEGDGFFITNPLFGRTSQTVVEDSGFAVVDTENYSIKRFDSDGVLAQIIRRSADRRVKASLVKAVIRDRLRYTPRRAWKRGEEVLRDRLYHSEPPALGRMISGGAGLLWVSEFRPSIREEEQWTVYGPDGEEKGTLEIPKHNLVLDISFQQVILGRATNSGLAELRVYGLEGGDTVDASGKKRRTP